MGMVSKVGEALQRLFGDLAEGTAKESRVIKRTRKFSVMTLTKTFVLGFLQDPRSSDEKLARFAVQCGVDVSPQAIEQRHTPELADHLKRLFQEATKIVVGSNKVLASLLKRFESVTVLDSSSVSLPEEEQERYRGCGAKNGGGKAAMKLQTEWDLVTGAISHVEIEEGRSCDNSSSRQDARRGPNSLRITDLGYFDLGVYATMKLVAEHFLSRLQFGTHVLLKGMDKAVDLQQWLAQQCPSNGFIDQIIVLGQRQRLECRLIAWRLPQEQADRRRAKLRQEMLSRKGREPSAARLAWCDWSILVTSVPVDKLAPKEAVVLYRARWQIELLFKRWKSQGLIAELSGSTAVRQMVRVWARLLAVLVQHWLVVSSVWGNLGVSLSKACEAVRDFASRLATATDESTLQPILDLITTVLTKTCRRDKRSKPGTFELLNCPDLLEFGLS